jgi:hypothetical protein
VLDNSLMRIANRLTGAHITGELEVEHADITAPISLHDCRFDEPISFFGSRLRRLSLEGSTLPGLIASNVIFDASPAGCACSAPPWAPPQAPRWTAAT